MEQLPLLASPSLPPALWVGVMLKREMGLWMAVEGGAEHEHC